ncbi:MAG: peptidoglycan DD-metalloendopeptidase family protein [Clostridia bacterium]|nr:peptidoglycan DD-metalloendopeptidase family protein [Clostridia bacterium]
MDILILRLKRLKEKVNSYINNLISLAGEHKQVVRAGGVAVGIIVCSLLIAVFFTSGYEVYMDGEKIAVVREKADFEQGLDRANAKITALAGEGYGINKIPQYVFTIAAKSLVSDNDEIVDSVMQRSDVISKVYVIKVDGFDIATSESKQVALNLVDKAASLYDGDNMKILNNVEIEGRYELTSRLTSDELAVKLLRNVLKVQTERKSVYEAQLMYQTITNPSGEMYVNEEKLLTEGKAGVMEVTAKVTEINGAVCDASIVSKTVVEEPVSEVVMVGTAERPSVGTGIFVQPYFGTITSRFGSRWGRTHKGTDIGGDIGDPIKAADNGIVITAEYQENGYGNIIIIDHQNGVHTWYAHLDSIGVAAGDVVEKGAVIGTLGNTGNSTGPHLHFEVRENGTPVDPGKYLENMN